MGLSMEEMEDIKDRWRAANKNIVSLWYELERACVDAVETMEVQRVRCLEIEYVKDIIYGHSFLRIKLPSGRALYYQSRH